MQSLLGVIQRFARTTAAANFRFFRGSVLGTFCFCVGVWGLYRALTTQDVNIVTGVLLGLAFFLSVVGPSAGMGTQLDEARQEYDKHGNPMDLIRALFWILVALFFLTPWLSFTGGGYILLSAVGLHVGLAYLGLYWDWSALPRDKPPLTLRELLRRKIRKLQNGDFTREP